MPIKTHHDDQPTLNLTPMIDIVFLLIIFFMVGTKFAEMERQIKLEVPTVKQFGALTAAPEKRVINVYRDGTIMMLGFAGYAVLRFVLEMIRVDEAGQFGTGLSISQLVSLVVFALSLVGLAWIYCSPRHSRTNAQAASGG